MNNIISLPPPLLCKDDERKGWHRTKLATAELILRTRKGPMQSINGFVSATDQHDGQHRTIGSVLSELPQSTACIAYTVRITTDITADMTHSISDPSLFQSGRGRPWGWLQ